MLERKNAATFIECTTVRPFIFKGSSFRCFYCTEYHSETRTLLEHTTAHKIENREEIFEKYVAKGKRCLQVDISKLKCRLCKVNFSNLDTIREHLKTEHGKHFFLASNGMTEYKLELVNSMFACHICGEFFHNFSLLNGHMNSHVGKVVCETCGEGFLYQHLLLKHKESHFTKPFSCKECDKSFVKKSQLIYHTNVIHKGKERFKWKKCPKCPQIFKEHYAKLLHLKKVHGIAKTFPCHICAKSFTTRRAVTEHLTRFHTEKLKCEVCSKCFGVENRLKEHMRGHTGERNFICPVCKNAYMHKRTLNKHMRTHETVLKYNCTECGAGFHKKNDYDKHMKQWHSS